MPYRLAMAPFNLRYIIIAESFAFVKREKHFLKTLLFLLLFSYLRYAKKERATLLVLDLSRLLCYNKAENHERRLNNEIQFSR